MTTRILRILPIITFVLGAFSSCIKDELPNIEVDIISVSSPTGEVLNTIIQSNHVEVFAVPGTDLTNMHLELQLSEGASIVPNPAEVTDYSQPRTFTVTSQDGAWRQEYLLTVRIESLPRFFDFEHWTQPDKMRYMIPYEAQGSSQMMIWACGNQAYNFLTNKNDNYTAFPTQPTTEAYAGQYAAKMVTRLTGQIDRPIAAGSLFIGQFDGSKYEPKESTMFGLPFTAKPLKITGMYKYRSGGLTNKSQTPDRGSIRAILYRTDTGISHLNGFTIKTSPAIVARAEFAEPFGDTPGQGYSPFSLDFVYSAPIDMELLARGGYNLAINFSSSTAGDEYDGAEGSTLLIDNVEIICEP